MRINLDEGYLFGLGLFETIAVEAGEAVFLVEHLERLGRSMQFLRLRWDKADAAWEEDARTRIADYLAAHPGKGGRDLDLSGGYGFLRRVFYHQFPDGDYAGGAAG